MRGGSLQTIARPVYYDRTPTARAFDFSGGSTAPHTDTVRVTYTVPAGRKAFVEWFSANVKRAVPATTAGGAVAYSYYNPLGAGNKLMYYRFTRGNAVGDGQDINSPTFGFMLATDTISISTADTSIGGSVDYFIGMKIAEFDA